MQMIAELKKASVGAGVILASDTTAMVWGVSRILKSKPKVSAVANASLTL
jgi:hypothetical protein